MEHDRCQLVLLVSLFRACKLNSETLSTGFANIGVVNLTKYEMLCFNTRTICFVSSLINACLVSHGIHSSCTPKMFYKTWSTLEVRCSRGALHLFQEVRVQALQRSLCCVLGQDTFTFTVYHVLTQLYKCAPVNLMLGVTLQWLGIPSREEFISIITSFTETRLSSEL